MKTYEEQIEDIDKKELERRVKMVAVGLKSQMVSNSRNIFNELLSKEFDEFNIHAILNSINNINMLMKADDFVKNGIINPDLAQKLDKNLTK